MADASKLTAEERETIIIFNEASSTANITTWNKATIRRLRQIKEKSQSVDCVFDNGEYAEYNLSKKMVSIKSPRVISEEQRRELSERAKRNLVAGGDAVAK